MPTNRELEKNLIEMAKAVKELAIDVAEIKKGIEKPKPPEIKPPQVPELTNSKFPIPPEYRELVDFTLNKQFGIEIEWQPAGFLFTIVVPEKYSTLTPKDKELIKIDKRTKLIPNFEGANGVKTWVELVYNSFSTETKSLITNDR